MQEKTVIIVREIRGNNKPTLHADELTFVALTEQIGSQDFSRSRHFPDPQALDFSDHQLLEALVLAYFPAHFHEIAAVELAYEKGCVRSEKHNTASVVLKTYKAGRGT
jgi:hypothetical protein